MLGDVGVERACSLLVQAANPRMDLVVVVSRDASAQSATAAPQPPPGMSAAQFAIVQRMLARQRGTAAQTSTSKGPPDPNRGPKISLTLYRMGEESSIVWTTHLVVDKLMDLAHNMEQEHEDLSVQDLVWSPSGDRFAVLLTLRRSPTKASSSVNTIRVASFVKTYSVQNGELLSTLPLTQVASAELQDRITLSWSSIHFDAGTVVSPLEQVLRQCRPLPALPSKDTFTNSNTQGNLMPHQLRMMQMSGKTPPPAFTYPSTLALQNRGALASIPMLPQTTAQLGLVDSSERETATAGGDSLPLTPTTMLVVTRHASHQADFLLDATVLIGTVTFPHSVHVAALAPDLSALFSLHVAEQWQLQIARLPLHIPAQYAPECVLSRISRVSRASHLLRVYLGYSIDTLVAIAHIYTRDWCDKVTNEWKKLLLDAETKFGIDIQYDLLCVLLTGRAGSAADHLLLASLTEGVLTRLEQQFHAAAYEIKRLLAHSARPALERAIMSAQHLLGLTRFFYHNVQHSRLEHEMRALQAVLSSVVRLARLVDMEAVVMQEFLRWCRVERERQERIKQDQDEPRLAVTYDVLTVARFIQRGFDHPDIAHILAPTKPPASLPDIDTPAPPELQLHQTLAEATAHLAGSGVTTTPHALPHRREVSVLPTLESAAGEIGALIQTLLTTSLDSVTIDSSVVSAKTHHNGALLTESSAAIDSLVNSLPNETSAAAATTTHVLTRRVDNLTETRIAVITNTHHIYIYRLSHSPTTTTTTTPHIHTISGFVEDTTARVVDMAFFGTDELVLLLSSPSDPTATLLTVDIAAPEINGNARHARTNPTRTIHLPYIPSAIAVNTNKQTVTLLTDDGKHLIYLDIPPTPDADADMVQD